MHNNQKIGVGVVTCNRPKLFAELLAQLKQLKCIDYLRIVKNKTFDYYDADPTKTDPDITTVIEDDVGVGVCKNTALKDLLYNDCKHIFLIEDDVKIKRNDVLEAYIDTAAEFGLHHLNFCHTYDQLVTHTYLEPFVSFKHKNYAIDIYRRLSGVFEYFTDVALKTVGIIDEKYINALEHCEHTFRIAQAGLTTPFNAFADIHNSKDYLEDQGIHTTISRDNILYQTRLNNAFELFKLQHGPIQSQPVPNCQQIVDSLDCLIERKQKQCSTL